LNRGDGNGGRVTLWHGPEYGRILSEPIDPLVAAYDRRSGQTHLLMSPMPEILAALDAGPCDLATIERRLIEQHGLEPDPSNAGLIAERVAELALLGLVEAK
jgi:PqqD family protein of HPr-rel-A system